ncbi:MAG: SemiSWEET transporter [Thiotrichales bacterium]|jgi:MtN3 and saliva related transmembrane protein|nr:SemiSWEET transporter [Thiotrichales bacterium]
METLLQPQVLGYIAGALTTFSFLPQAIKTLKTRDTQSISLLMYALFVTGVGFWLLYGWTIGDNTLIIANSVTLLFASPILLMKLQHVWRVAKVS